MSDNGSDRLARMEEAITAMATAIKNQSDTTARGFETLVSMNRVLDARMGVLEGQLGEVIGRLKSIGEQLADHVQGHGSAA